MARVTNLSLEAACLRVFLSLENRESSNREKETCSECVKKRALFVDEDVTRARRGSNLEKQSKFDDWESANDERRKGERLVTRESGAKYDVTTFHADREQTICTPRRSEKIQGGTDSERRLPVASRSTFAIGGCEQVADTKITRATRTAVNAL